jgi:hypothetical protein
MARLQHVYGVVALVCQATPVGDGKGFRQACDAYSEVVLPRPDCPFGGVGAMNVRLGVLVGCTGDLSVVT